LFKDIPIDELFTLQKEKKMKFIDVRSPSEYKEATIPGSHNIPIFDDEERAEVGRLYKQVSSEAAKERGLEIFSAKLPNFIREFSQIDGKKAVFCWRGGMRSKAAATVVHTPVAKEIEESLQSGKFYPAVKLLLEYYYDPRYDHSAKQYSPDRTFTIRAQNVEEAVEAIRNFVD
jgi:rhodanese-related sulfurtransferase